jgi:hypothetical protein
LTSTDAAAACQIDTAMATVITIPTAAKPYA